MGPLHPTDPEDPAAPTASKRDPTELVLGAWLGPNGVHATERWSDAIRTGPGTVQAPAHSADILVVEDEHVVALDLEEHLEARGHHVVVAFTGEDAVERARNEHFDVVLMDIKLGNGIDGIEAARAIRETLDVPIIYVTAYADSYTLDRARVTEPYGYILKPFQDRELHAAIEMALQRHVSDARRTVEMAQQTFLSQVSDRLASTLDFDGVLQRAAELVVPRYADWCLIGVDAPESPVRPSVLVHPGSDQIQPWRRDAATGLIDSVLREGRPTLVGADARAIGEQLGIGHVEVPALGSCMVLCLPFGAREHTLGVFAVALGHDRELGHNFAWVEDFAHRLGLAIDNALLFRRAREALLLRDEVLGVVSHDLRNPIATVILRAQSLAGNTQAAPIANAIVVTARRMNRLVDDLLDASAINSGSLVLDRKPWKASLLAEEGVQLLRPEANNSGVSLESAVVRDGLRVDGDRDRLLQVLTNLIGNAVRYTPRGGAVGVRAERHAGFARFRVTDTGPGIPVEKLPYLFDRFWRGDHDHPGAGLGLYVCRGIVQAHGGEIWVETSDRGTTFFFTIPLASVNS